MKFKNTIMLVSFYQSRNNYGDGIIKEYSKKLTNKIGKNYKVLVEDMSFDVTTTYFDDEVVATRCINEVIIPYIEEHGYWFPEYKGCKQIEEYLKNKIPQ